MFCDRLKFVALQKSNKFIGQSVVWPETIVSMVQSENQSVNFSRRRRPIEKWQIVDQSDIVNSQPNQIGWDNLRLSL